MSTPLAKHDRLIEMMGEFHTVEELDIVAFFARLDEWTHLPKAVVYRQEFIAQNIIWFTAVVDNLPEAIKAEHVASIEALEVFLRHHFANNYDSIRNCHLYTNGVQNWLNKFSWETTLKIPLSFTLRERG